MRTTRIKEEKTRINSLLKTSLFILVVSVVSTALYARSNVLLDRGKEPVHIISKIRLNKGVLRGEMMVTAYSKESSCHYPKNGKCLTAMGTYAREGIVACPRDWALGVKVLIASKEYTCEDRYAKYLSPRLDVWVEDHEEALNWGVKTLEITKYE